VTYDLPVPGSDKIAHAILGDWSLDAFVLARSAPPLNVVGAVFNVLRGFGASQADIGVPRVFRVTEQTGRRFRAEFFNILNHLQLRQSHQHLTNALFGRSTQTPANFLGAGGANGGFNPLCQIGGPRSIQLALKLQF
jgi:hypothetical protein